ncbi:MAG: hypothetical protein Q7K65_01445 [Candidatus Buchananbacteria bacterium]|nr:hypothetical protein [Candidatus Buchananbacteria bacterium]
MPLFDISCPQAERIESKLVPILPTKKQKKDIFPAVAKRVIGREIIEWSGYCGTYGQGGPGFLGFRLRKTFRYREEWLILRIWGATNWILVNDMWLAANPDQYNVQIPLYSNHYKKEWDHFSEMVIGKRIETFNVQEKTMLITVGSAVLSLGDDPAKRPRYFTGGLRELEKTDDLKEAWILSPYAWVEV